MPLLKFKNGNTWQEISVGKGLPLDTYPVGSVFLGPGFLYNYDGSSTSMNLTMSLIGYTGTSPASFIGGTWTYLQGQGMNSYGNLYYTGPLLGGIRLGLGSTTSYEVGYAWQVSSGNVYTTKVGNWTDTGYNNQSVPNWYSYQIDNTGYLGIGILCWRRVS